MRRVVAIVAVIGCSWLAGPWAAAQNDWQFPDPYFGAIEFDATRPSRPPVRRVEPPPPQPRSKQVRPRPHRQRPRWTATGART